MKIRFLNIKIVLFIIMLFFVISLSSIIYAKYVIENAIIVANINIDRTAPNLQVSYSQIDITENNVTVTITADEQIQSVEGWSISADKKSISKEYQENSSEDINVKDVFGNATLLNINVNNIDRIKPKIQLVNISNDNYGYEKFANYNSTIKFEIEILEKNIAQNNFLEENIQISLDENIVKNKFLSIKNINETEDSLYYEVCITNLQGNGNLKLVIKDGIIIDKTGKKNEKLEIDSGITIDNIAPKVEFKEIPEQLGKSQGKISLDEKIRDLEGWTIQPNTNNYIKDFLNNCLYEMDVYDYANNKSTVLVKISNATYINLTYCSHNSEVGWTYGNGVNQIAGENAIKINPLYKTEALAFNISGNVDSDFVKMRAYVYDYWGENSQGICYQNKILYNYGYNPSSTSWKSMDSKDLVTMNNKKYFQFGGSSINAFYQKDSNGERPIPADVAKQYLYGISAITMELKDYSYYSIVYQVYVDGKGWLSAKSDGEEAVYKYTKPISAIRMNIIPKTEKDNLISYWNKD